MLAASAAFYEGLGRFTKEDWKGAQESFEWVLDNSEDAALDKKADEYLELIARAIQAEKMFGKKWRLNASFGANYDSNVLFTPDSDIGSAQPQNEGGLRTLFQGEVNRKLTNKKSSDLSARASTLYMYSFDDAFSLADPWLTNAGLVWNTRGTTKQNEAYQLAIRPGFETLYMDAEQTGNRENIMNSGLVRSDLTLVKSDAYFAAYSFELRFDDSTLAVTNPRDNLDAVRYTAETTHTRFLEKSKKKALIGRATYMANDTKGANRNFNRLEGAVTYMAPIDSWKNTTYMLGVSIFRMVYPEADNIRRDTNLAVNGTISKVINDNWSFASTASYTNNASNLETNQFNRFNVLGLAIYTWTGD